MPNRLTGVYLINQQNTTRENNMKAFGWICSYLLLIPLSITFSGYALSILWDWFIATQFGLGSISIPSAIGLALIINYTTYQSDIEKDNEKMEHSERLGKAVGMAIVRPSMALFTGWVITLFM